MAETWELICHHTYQGIPGVVVDTSPAGASYGRAIGLNDSDFLVDGAAPGSGSVQFYKNGSIFVHADTAAWQSIVGIKGEVILRYRGPRTHTVDDVDFYVIDSDAFKVHIYTGDIVAWFSSSSAQNSQIDSGFDQVGTQPYYANRAMDHSGIHA
jgi:hypothetical protein